MPLKPGQYREEFCGILHLRWVIRIAVLGSSHNESPLKQKCTTVAIHSSQTEIVQNACFFFPLFTGDILAKQDKCHINFLDSQGAKLL